MVNYNLSKIYKIVDNTNGNIYIGSTCEPTLARRLAGHRQNYKRYLENKKNFITSFNILKNDNYEIVLLEECKDITTKDQLHKRERFYIENNDCVNIVRNVGLQNELGKVEYQKKYHQENKEKILEQQKQYNQDNKEKMSEYNKQYKQDNKEKISEYNKHYQQDNKEKISEYNKQYQQDNKEKINERSRERYKINKIKNEE